MNDTGTPLLAPPYAAVQLWCCRLPATGRAQRKQALHRWLQSFLPQHLPGQLELAFAAGQAPRLRHNGQPLGLSLSYAGALGLAALRRKSNAARKQASTRTTVGRSREMRIFSYPR